MLDKRTGALLFRLNTLCKEGGYQIIEEGELLSESGLENGETLLHMLEYLTEHGYIDMKYAKDGVYCLCPRPEGRMYFENALRERVINSRHTRGILFLTALGSFLGSLLGAFFAVLIAVAVA